jgi:hypothetical protein
MRRNAIEARALATNQLNCNLYTGRHRRNFEREDVALGPRCQFRNDGCRCPRPVWEHAPARMRFCERHAFDVLDLANERARFNWLVCGPKERGRLQRCLAAIHHPDGLYVDRLEVSESLAEAEARDQFVAWFSPKQPKPPKKPWATPYRLRRRETLIQRFRCLGFDRFAKVHGEGIARKIQAHAEREAAGANNEN